MKEESQEQCDDGDEYKWLMLAGAATVKQGRDVYEIGTQGSLSEFPGPFLTTLL